MIYLRSNDLMFESQTSQAARSIGEGTRSFASDAALLEAIKSANDDDEFAIVVVDLTAPGIDLTEISQQVKARKSVARQIAVGPHVHKQKLADATSAGWETFTRGQFHAEFAKILAQ